MVERFGAERLIREGGAELVSEDEVGRLWRRPLDGGRWPREEPIVMVEVLNSTPEPDDTQDLLPARAARTQTAREAVAWTFGLRRRRVPPGGPVLTSNRPALGTRSRGRATNRCAYVMSSL